MKSGPGGSSRGGYDRRVEAFGIAFYFACAIALLAIVAIKIA